MYLIGVPALLIGFLTGFGLLFTKRRKKWGAIILICCAGFTGTRLIAESGWNSNFNSMPDGLSEKEIKEKLWWWTFDFEDGDSPLGYALKDSNEEVKKEIWCVAFFVPEQYAFGLDSDGKLIARYHYVSP